MWQFITLTTPPSELLALTHIVMPTVKVRKMIKGSMMYNVNSLMNKGFVIKLQNVLKNYFS